jgi:hypothetical protein
MADIVLHEGFKPAQAQGARFGQCLLVRPVVMDNAITGNQYSSAVGSAPAVYEDRCGGRIPHNGQQSGNLFIPRCEDSGKPLRHILHAGGAHLLPFFRHMKPSAPQIDYGLDAHLC